MALYNFVECKTEEYTIKNGVFKYTGTENAIIIPDDVTTIKATSIKSRKTKAIRIGKNVTAIETNSLEWFEVDEENSTFSSFDGVLLSKDRTEIIQYPAMNSRTTYSIPESVTIIRIRAFEGAKAVNIITHDKIENIERCCFHNTPKLKSFNWPANVTVIHDMMFCRSGLNSISIPNGVKKIESWAFEESKLNSISLPDSVEKIGEQLFYNCQNLSSVSLSSRIKTIPGSCFYSCKSLTSISLPEKLERIEDSAFSFTGIQSITIPSTVTEVGSVFDDIKNVTYTGQITDEIKAKIEQGEEKKKEKERFHEETQKRLAEAMELRASIEEDGLYIYQQNAKRLVQKRDENEEALGILFASRKYTEYNRLLLEVNEIPKAPICTYNYCNKNLKLYSRNKIDGSFAVEVDGIIYVINTFSSGIRETVIDYRTDASQLDKAIMAGIAGGSLLGYLATQTAQVYNTINNGFTLYNTKTGQDIVRISFGDDYRIRSSQFDEVFSAMSKFLNAFGSCLRDDYTADEKATATYIITSLDQIRAKIESKRKRLAEKERTERDAVQKRFDEYWTLHSEEKTRLQSEKAEIREKIQSMQSSLHNQIFYLNNQLDKNPLVGELSRIEERIAMLTVAKSSLGLFKGKQKKEIQGQIDQANIEKNGVQWKIDSERRVIDGRITTLQNQTANSIRELESRINAIDEELTKAR